MIGKIVITMGLVLAGSACKTLNRAPDQDSDLLSYESVGKVPPMVCDNAELVSFSLHPAETADPANLKFFAGDQGPYQLVQPSNQLNVRLDMCISPNQDVELKRLVYLKHPDQAPLVININRFSKVVGLEKAIFDNEHQDVVIEINPTNKEGYLIKGWQQGEQSFVTFSPSKRHAEGFPVPDKAPLLVGSITYGDPWQEGADQL